jgi:hypothetical protein
MRAEFGGAASLMPDVSGGLAWLCRELVSDLDLMGATVTLMVPEGPQGVAAVSDDSIRSVDALHFDLGEGPSLDAFLGGQPVLVFALADKVGRWPGFAPAATGAGAAAVYAFPLQLGAVRFGVFTSYSDTPRALGRHELSTCAFYAEMATEFLIERASGYEPSGGPETFLEHDVQVRTEVYQAQGMVMVDLGVSLADALSRLRALAFAGGADLNELAADIVAGRRHVSKDVSTQDPSAGDLGA